MHPIKTFGDKPFVSANKFTYPSRKYPKIYQKTSHYVSKLSIKTQSILCFRTSLCQTRTKNFQNLPYVKQNLYQNF